MGCVDWVLRNNPPVFPEGSAGKEESHAGGHLLHTCAGHVAKILTPRQPMLNRNTETELEEMEKQTGKPSGIVSQGLWPPFSGIGRGFISS